MYAHINAIFVSINGQLIQVDALFSDGFGIRLAITSSGEKFPSGKRSWQCPRCNYLNVKEAKICQNDKCGWNSETDPLWE